MMKPIKIWQKRLQNSVFILHLCRK